MCFRKLLGCVNRSAASNAAITIETPIKVRNATSDATSEWVNLDCVEQSFGCCVWHILMAFGLEIVRGLRSAV